MYTLEELQDKTFKELKEIGWQLNVLPDGDRRCRQNWIDAIAGVLPPLLELLEVSPGVDRVEAAPAIERTIDYLDCPECGAVHALYATSVVGGWRVECIYCTYAEYSREHPFEKTRPFELPIDRLNYLPVVAVLNDEQPPNRGDGRGRLEVEPKVSQSAIELQHQEPINESPGVTFSPRFLAPYSPPQIERISYKADADGQLSLLDFDIESADEPPDPDDLESIEAFWDAMTAWDAEHSELLEVSIDSFREWAPCPLEWYEPQETAETSSTLETSPVPVESSITCDFLIPVFDTQKGDRTTGNDEPPTAGICARRPLPKPPSFPPTVVAAGDRSSIKKFARCAILLSGRAPPGGDAVPFT